MIKSTLKSQPLKIVLMAGLATATLAAMPEALAAGYSTQSINSPGPSVRMSENGAIAGYYQTQCGNIQTRSLCLF